VSTLTLSFPVLVVESTHQHCFDEVPWDATLGNKIVYSESCGMEWAYPRHLERCSCGEMRIVTHPGHPSP
jgi:hypothetical protein